MHLCLYKRFIPCYVWSKHCSVKLNRLDFLNMSFGPGHITFFGGVVRVLHITQTHSHVQEHPHPPQIQRFHFHFHFLQIEDLVQQANSQLESACLLMSAYCANVRLQSISKEEERRIFHLAARYVYYTLPHCVMTRFLPLGSALKQRWAWLIHKTKYRIKSSSFLNLTSVYQYNILFV